MEELTLEEKARRYDEIQSWWWWLQRRIVNRISTKLHMNCFMKGLAENLAPYTQEEETEPKKISWKDVKEVLLTPEERSEIEAQIREEKGENHE